MGQCCLQNTLFVSHIHLNFTSVAILRIASARLPVSYTTDLCSKQIRSSRAKDFVVQKTVQKTLQVQCNTEVFIKLEAMCIEKL